MYDFCCRAAISGNGRFVAFNSRAVDLVPGDRNHTTDVFVKDLRSGAIERVSVGTAGRESTGVCIGTRQDDITKPPEEVGVMSGSGEPSISRDGRFVAFSSCATNLVPGDTNKAADVFVYDRLKDSMNRASVSSSGEQTPPDVFSAANPRVSLNRLPNISANGRYVAFVSRAGSLVADDRNDADDVFVHDLRRHRTERVSLSSEGREGTRDGVNTDNLPALSDDGRFVAFSSVLRDLVPGDTNGAGDVFVRDRKRDRTERVSVASDGTQGDVTGYGQVPAVFGDVSISRDGGLVSFGYLGGNLVPEDRNGTYDVFVHDRGSARTSRVSVDSEGSEFTSEFRDNMWSVPASMSADGRYTTFVTWRFVDNLTFDDISCSPFGCGRDVYEHFIHDSRTGETSLLNDHRRRSRALVGDTVDGRRIVFMSDGRRFVPGDTNGIADAFLHDRGGEVGAAPVHRAALSEPGGGNGVGTLLGARLVMRDGRRDLFGVIEVAKLGLPRSPIAYEMAFAVGDRRYEVRVGPSRQLAPALYDCSARTPIPCTKLG
ncbi:MAG: hypothetical protein ACRDLB_09250, partial [Actinomycetota bacterium]